MKLCLTERQKVIISFLSVLCNLPVLMQDSWSTCVLKTTSLLLQTNVCHVHGSSTAPSSYQNCGVLRFLAMYQLSEMKLTVQNEITTLCAFAVALAQFNMLGGMTGSRSHNRCKETPLRLRQQPCQNHVRYSGSNEGEIQWTEINANGYVLRMITNWQRKLMKSLALPLPFAFCIANMCISRSEPLNQIVVFGNNTTERKNPRRMFCLYH